MKLSTLNYIQWEGQPKEWRLEGLLLRPVNLLVGSNASGKSRTLNVISGLARLLAGDTKVSILSGSWDVTFDHDEKILKYQIQINDGQVTKEHFSIGETVYLNRGNSGEGRIWAEKLGTEIDFQAPQDELAAVSRRDSIQHPFFESLNAWGASLRHYYFGTPLGKDRFGLISQEAPKTFDPKDPNQVIAIYRKGEKDFGDRFKESIKRDMASIDYFIDDVGAQKPVSVRIQGPEGLVAMYVKETALDDVTDQVDMSQGMFRVLSLIIQLNYSEFSQTPSCILMDDIGEGLDFERSCALIKLIVQKAQKSSVQLIMATNDRFIMNAVPLEAWTLLRRAGKKVQIYNYTNSRERFDEFKFTGLNNFDFFALNFTDDQNCAK